MGEVYRARDTRLDRTVAIKVLRADSLHHRNARDRFEREARAISHFTHPHICALYDVGVEGDVPFLVMEYLQGETLASRIARGPLRIDEVLAIGADIAEGLDAAHREGIVHRDLKPGNVILTRDGVKLLDFGLAKTHGTEPSSAEQSTTVTALTEAGLVLGTVPYMAPGQECGCEDRHRRARRRVVRDGHRDPAIPG
jgi:serine/threonine protein kinase